MIATQMVAINWLRTTLSIGEPSLETTGVPDVESLRELVKEARGGPATDLPRPLRGQSIVTKAPPFNTKSRVIRGF